jgi:SEC-C motif/Aspartyl protease
MRINPPPPPPAAFTVKYTGRANRIVSELMVSPAFDVKQKPPDDTQYAKTMALWDTGATKSVITDKLAASLGLIPTGTTFVTHAGGREERDTHIVHFFLPNQMIIPGVLVSTCIDSNTFGAIVGMDIIAHGDFSITNVGGITWASFRMPSIVAIDYVVESNRLIFAGVGRNDPCPCKSGKKYKNCHL